MATLRKAYRFRMRPTPAQEQAMLRIAGARRFVWNWALARRKEHYAATGKSLTTAMLSKELTALRRAPETVWLGEINRECTVQALRDLDKAFASFFARRARFPRFKARKQSLPAFRCHRGLRIVGDAIVLPMVGRVRLRLSRSVMEKITGATIKRHATGRWFVTLAVAFEMPDVVVPMPAPDAVAGIDAGLKDFVVVSTGERIAAPKFYRAAQRKLARAQRVLSRRRLGSNGRAKAKLKIARIHARTADRRSDFLHKLSTRLILSHDGLCIEDLNVKGLARTKLAKSFYDAAHGELRRQLEYKSLWNRKHLVVIDRFFPSSRLCRGCGAINDKLTLSDRAWACDCGMEHDRDLLAAINIRDEGLHLLASGHGESQNAGGAYVRPAKVGNRQ